MPQTGRTGRNSPKKTEPLLTSRLTPPVLRQNSICVAKSCQKSSLEKKNQAGGLVETAAAVLGANSAGEALRRPLLQLNRVNSAPPFMYAVLMC